MTSRPLLFAHLYVFAFLSALASPAFAAPMVDARMSVALIQYNGTFEVTSAASAAKPGDTLEYTARYANRGDAAAQSLMPTMPIPVGTEYMPSSATPAPTHASLDGVRYEPIPLRRPARGDDGVVREVEVPMREYRALRWTVGTLAAGSEVMVRARVRVNAAGSLASR